MTTHPNTQPAVYTPQSVTTMPTHQTIVTHGVNPQVTSPRQAVVVGNAATKRTGFVSRCADVARRTGRLIYRYRTELAPTGVVGALTGLGWVQHLAGAGQAAAEGYGAVAVLSAVAASWALECKHHNLFNGAASLGIALGDIAIGVAGGPNGYSLTAAAVSTGLAYGVYVPWLIEHRRSEAAIAGKTVKAQVEIVEPEPAVLPAGQVSPFHWDVIPYQDDASDDLADPIRIGWDENGQPVHLTMLYRHTLIAGASDWGKSGLMNLIIKKLLKKKHVELYGIDLKPGAPELGPWAPKFKRIATTPEEARDLLKWLRTDTEKRGAQLEALSKQELAAGRPPVRKWVPGVHGPARFVITDELGELIRQDEELRKQEAEWRKTDPESYPPEQDIATTYESGLAVARFLATQFVSCTQQPSNRVFGGNTDARGNYTNRLSTRVGEAGHSRLVFGEGCKGNGFTPEKLTRPGEFYLACPEMPLMDPPRCRAEYVTDHDIAADVAHLHTAPSAAPAAQPALWEQVDVTRPRPAIRLVKAPPALAYPDGSTVGRDEWPELYRVFCRLCEENGAATKEDLVAEGPFASRDTVRRALEAWEEHGVLSRKEGRAVRYYLPDEEEEAS